MSRFPTVKVLTAGTFSASTYGPAAPELQLLRTYWLARLRIGRISKSFLKTGGQNHPSLWAAWNAGIKKGKATSQIDLGDHIKLLAMARLMAVIGFHAGWLSQVHRLLRLSRLSRRVCHGALCDLLGDNILKWLQGETWKKKHQQLLEAGTQGYIWIFLSVLHGFNICKKSSVFASHSTENDHD